MKVDEQYKVLTHHPSGAHFSVGEIITVRYDDGHESFACNTETDPEYWYLGPENVAEGDLELVINSAVIEEGNPLYHYRASEETGADAWSTLVKAVAHHTLWQDVKEQFKGWEEEYKITTSLPVPGAWRSAKSVIKGAFNNAIPLMNGEEARGKTAVEKDIKAAKDSPVIKNAQDKLHDLVEKAYQHAKQNGLMFKASTDDGEWQTS